LALAAIAESLVKK